MKSLIKIITQEILEKEIVSEDLNVIAIVNEDKKAEIIYKSKIVYLKYPKGIRQVNKMQEINFLDMNKGKKIIVNLINNEQIIGTLVNYFKDKVIIGDNNTIYEIFKDNIISIRET